MTWEDIKQSIKTLYGEDVGSGNLIEDTSGSPTALAYLLDFVHSRIASYPREWPFLKVTATITLTGATSYNLATLFPDLKSVYQIYGINSYQESTYLSNKEANIAPVNDAYTLKGKMLYFTGSVPASGTATIQYKSSYLVQSAAGARKHYFENADDVSVLDGSNINVLVFGVGQFIDWKADTKAKEKRDSVREWFGEAWQNMILDNEQTSQASMLL